jgi:hypothetical protein
LYKSIQEQPEHPILLFLAQEDSLTPLRPLLSPGVGQRQDVECRLGEVQAQVVVEGNSRHEAETLGLIQSLQVGGEKVVRDMTDRTHVLIQLVGLTNLLREGTNEKMHIDQIKYVINFVIQDPVVMAMHANFSILDSQKGPSPLQSQLQHLLTILSLTATILLQSNGKDSILQMVTMMSVIGMLLLSHELERILRKSLLASFILWAHVLKERIVSTVTLTTKILSIMQLLLRRKILKRGMKRKKIPPFPQVNPRPLKLLPQLKRRGRAEKERGKARGRKEKERRDVDNSWSVQLPLSRPPSRYVVLPDQKEMFTF